MRRYRAQKPEVAVGGRFTMITRLYQITLPLHTYRYQSGAKRITLHDTVPFSLAHVAPAGYIYAYHGTRLLGVADYINLEYVPPVD